ncbi:hypothetical protein EDD22DRAFT_853035 [Suillus occidentalis]|nr:hypothetical protein EDD22DRAFT_853035 [Suillus occidentalis]
MSVLLRVRAMLIGVVCHLQCVSMSILLRTRGMLKEIVVCCLQWFHPFPAARMLIKVIVHHDFCLLLFALSDQSPCLEDILLMYMLLEFDEAGHPYETLLEMMQLTPGSHNRWWTSIVLMQIDMHVDFTQI